MEIKNAPKKKSQSLQKKDSTEYLIRIKEIQIDGQIYKQKYISIYDDDIPMTKEEIVIAMELILDTLNVNEKTADFVCEILADEMWSMKKLRDAIKHVIKTHKYKEVKPADILSYDKGIEIYNYLEMLEAGGYGFICVLIPGLRNAVKKTDSIKTEYVDAGWYIKSTEVLPELWKHWGVG